MYDYLELWITTKQTLNSIVAPSRTLPLHLYIDDAIKFIEKELTNNREIFLEKISGKG